ncbi:MAG: GTPase [Candidatus Thermoplasmatota archaeon]|nr:GTPase [Candidatus Thermoplasmatota archaeon]
MEKGKRRVLIMGAAGRDFHNFNTVFRDNDKYKVVAFTATQIPDIEERRYPPSLSGELYPDGIPIIPEEKLTDVVKEERIDEVVFSYSDVPHEYVMHKGSEVVAAGADFTLLGVNETMLKARLPVISVCAVRTGAGKSQTTRKICEYLNEDDLNLVTVRHPMPYGDLEKQAVQRFADYEDLDIHECTIEEREEYEPYINKGMVIYAGVDYGAILREAEKEGDILVWDGGNNDTPFYRPDLHIVLLDPHRVGHETTYHPGETNLKMADICIINKCDTAPEEQINQLEKNIEKENPDAEILRANSPVTAEDPDAIKGKKVLVIEDGPTVTHGEMSFGAGKLAAEKFGAGEIIDPRDSAVGTIHETFEEYPHLEEVLPAMGYSSDQISDLEQTIEDSDCEVVISGTPIDLNRVLETDKPVIDVTYELEIQKEGRLEEILEGFKSNY